MKIGLIRHFKVKMTYPKKILISKVELNELFRTYNQSDIIVPQKIQISNNWNQCYSSPLKRAKHTAEYLHQDTIYINHHLQEIEALDLLKGNMKLPLVLWAILLRYKTFSNKTLMKKHELNIQLFINEILKSKKENILIVSHGFIMILLRKELARRGFKGAKFIVPKNGKLYEFDR